MNFLKEICRAEFIKVKDTYNHVLENHNTRVETLEKKEEISFLGRIRKNEDTLSIFFFLFFKNSA